jgi:hypothetical protein
MSINLKTIGIWVLKLLAAVIMLQTLFYKFSASPESVYIFSAIGMEPWGRIGTGIMELIASVLITYSHDHRHWFRFRHWTNERRTHLSQ